MFRIIVNMERLGVKGQKYARVYVLLSEFLANAKGGIAIRSLEGRHRMGVIIRLWPVPILRRGLRPTPRMLLTGPSGVLKQEILAQDLSHNFRGPKYIFIV